MKSPPRTYNSNALTNTTDSNPGASSTRFPLWLVLLASITALIHLLTKDDSLRWMIFSSEFEEYTAITSVSKSTDATNIHSDLNAKPHVNAGPPKIGFMTNTILSKDGNGSTDFDNFIFPALDTWLSEDHDQNIFGKYFVVMNEESEVIYQRRVCYDNHTTQQYCSRIVPIWTQCADPKLAMGVCCQCESSLLQILDDYPDIHWIVYMEARTYVRTRLLSSYLMPFTNDESMEPVVGVVGESTRLPGDCSGNFSYPQSAEFFFLYSRKALNVLQNGWRFHALRTTCLTFGSMPQQAFSILNWVYSLPTLILPRKRAEPLHEDTTTIVFGGLAPDHGGGRTMRSCFRSDDGSHTTTPPITYSYHWHNTTDFEKTRLYKKLGDPKNWDSNDDFPILSRKDCLEEHELEKREKEEVERKRKELEEEKSKIQAEQTKPSETESTEKLLETEGDKKLSESTKQTQDDTKKPSIAFVTFANDKAIFTDYIFPALETWLGHDGALYHVIMHSSQKPFYKPMCHENENRCKRIRPVWVDDCMVSGPCCLQEKGLLQAYHNNSNMDWFFFTEPDVYVRLDYLRLYLAEPTTKKFPIAGTTGPLYTLGLSMFHDSSYNCSESLDFQYPWGNPILYNRRALEVLSRGLEASTLMRICTTFDAAHDIGLQVLNWMYSIPALRLPLAQVVFHGLKAPDLDFGEQTEDHESAVVLHGVLKAGDSREVGCVMEQCHKHYTQQRLQKTDGPYQYFWHKPNGFSRSPTFNKHGNPSMWSGEDFPTLSLNDCIEQVTL